MKRRINFQTISWFNDLYRRQLLNLEPRYQRRSVWNQSYKDYFIDTILLNYPAPAIFLYESIDARGIAKYHVVDGKQRLTTVFEFIEGRYSVGDIVVKTEMRGKYFEELPKEVKNEIWTYLFSVEYVPTTEESIINNIFDRINRNVARLSSQELRHARFSGYFITVSEDLTDWMFVQHQQNFPRIAKQSRKQMKDVELIAQLLLLIENSPRGYSINELDKAFSDRDAEWEEKDEIIHRFKETVGAIKSVLKYDSEHILLRSRFKNQADFYSFFGVIFDLKKEERLSRNDVVLRRLKKFLDIVDDENERPKYRDIELYYEYAWTASNRTKARKERARILKDIISGQLRL